MTGYEEVKSWFIQAIPAATQYIELNDSREVIVRFRVTDPTNDLSLTGLANPSYYLGHDPDTPVTPRQVGIDIKMLSQGFYWKASVESQLITPLFAPNGYE